MQLPSRWNNPVKKSDRSDEQVESARDSSGAQDSGDGQGGRADENVEGYGETLYFPAQIRPETLRFPERDEPFDVDDTNAETERRAAAAQASRERSSKKTDETPEAPAAPDGPPALGLSLIHI